MVETLIDQEQECLWNMSIPDYKDKRKRTLAFEAIDDTMETAAEVKRTKYTAKWVNLRTQFLWEYNNQPSRVVVSNA